MKQRRGFAGWRRRVTPVTENGLRKYDHLPAVIAIVEAWSKPGSHPEWDEACKAEVRNMTPLLGRALDRLARELGR